MTSCFHLVRFVALCVNANARCRLFNIHCERYGRAVCISSTARMKVCLLRGYIFILLTAWCVYERINWIKWMRFPLRKYTLELSNFIKMFISNDFQLMKFTTKSTQMPWLPFGVKVKIEQYCYRVKIAELRIRQATNALSVRSFFSVNEGRMEIMIESG